MFPHFLVLNIGQGCTVPLEEMNIDFKIQSKIKEIIPVINDNFLLNQRLSKLKKVEQRLKKLPKSQRGQLTEIQKQINTIKSWIS